MDQMEKLVSVYSGLNAVTGIILGGSRATGFSDIHSDIDLYVYTDGELTIEQRKEAARKLMEYREVDNHFWESEDNGILNDGITPIDVIYRDIHATSHELERVVEGFQASCGYSTCIWGSVVNGTLLYDRKGDMKSMLNRFSVVYPEELREQIVSKNYALLRKALPAYYFQIEKARIRGDVVAVQHRITAFMASYFDILFALNRIIHPGEKRMTGILELVAEKLPERMIEDIRAMFRYGAFMEAELTDVMDQMLDRLDILLECEGFLKGSEGYRNIA